MANRNDWVGVATHPYKVNPKIKVGGVPTVLLVSQGEVMMRAESEDHFKNEEYLMAIAKHE